MEMGVGIHGEPGRRRILLASADAIAAELLDVILKDLAPGKGSEVLLLVNGFGATPLIELYLMVNSARRILDGAGITVTRFLTGSHVTSLDMAGVSITVSVPDSQAKRLWDAPVHTAALRCAGASDLISRLSFVTAENLSTPICLRPVPVWEQMLMGF
jgi:phosphoenolpyruvate---glycerone phosphotransferase subunit DhaK